MPRRRRAESSKQLQPTVNRFAEDTSMLGFRYLHTRYKTWFRLLWALVLVFFVGLTVYQVCERIAFYFIRNPLTTRRFYESPQHMRFPSVGICNKMQIRASPVAAREPQLARLLSLLYDDDGNLSRNETVLDELRRFDGVDVLSIHKAAHQKVDDLFLRCELGKSGSCVDEIRPVVTPQGLCFVVSPNLTVQRPGPESTLSLLLNLEVYDVIPGTAVEPGVVLSIHDHDDSLADYTSGIHLEPGKVVTIPINEVRKLTRYHRHCGRRAVGPFNAVQYSRAACEWVAIMEKVEDICQCRPVYSPYNLPFFVTEEEETADGTNLTRQHAMKSCTFSQEVTCVSKYVCFFASWFWKISFIYCEEVSFSSVVFGGNLVASDLLPLLPSEWEDMKESKAARLQRALRAIPNHRIPVVREVQALANIAQQFTQLAMQVYSILPNITTTPCLAPKGGHELDRALTRLKAHEPIWERITTYFRRSLFHELKSTAVALGIELKGDASIEYSSSGNFRLNESTMVLSLLQLNVLESRTSFSFGLKSMEMMAPFIRKMKVCMMQVYNNADNATESAKECRQIFKDHYNVLVDAQTVYTFGQSISSVVQDYTTNVMKVVVAIQRFAFTNRLKILDWHDHQFEIRQFNTLYREGGNDNIEVHELMKIRKLMVNEIVNYIRPLTDHLENGLRARENVLQRLGVEHPHHPSLAVINETNSCLLKLARDVPLLKKSVFIRGEWLNRVQRQVEIVRSHSATPQYDQVNLLLVKLYFSHFKQEKIVQERSYNVFLLLGEGRAQQQKARGGSKWAD
ncbi:hypothetical protein Q1695_002881 [Nippostrongylus brasiliensis]|nr:hypothetical protein Q1695_002881 [Nippostrongylus brasiliensis]